jgi:hypothetical protein
MAHRLIGRKRDLFALLAAEGEPSAEIRKDGRIGPCQPRKLAEDDAVRDAARLVTNSCRPDGQDQR